MNYILRIKQINKVQHNILPKPLSIYIFLICIRYYF